MGEGSRGFFVPPFASADIVISRAKFISLLLCQKCVMLLHCGKSQERFDKHHKTGESKTTLKKSP